MNFSCDLSPQAEREFYAQINRYIEATGKDAPYVCNRTGLNVAIKAGMATPVADRSQIRAVAKREWWPKFVAKRISQGSKVKLKGKSPKKYGGRRHITGKYTREEARAASRQIVKNRVSKRGYIRSGWLPAIKALSAMKLRMRGRVTETPRWAQNPDKQPGRVTPARTSIAPVCEIVNAASGAGVVAKAALANAIPASTADMKQFIDEKYGETARKFNAR